MLKLLRLTATLPAAFLPLLFISPALAEMMHVATSKNSEAEVFVETDSIKGTWPFLSYLEINLPPSPEVVDGRVVSYRAFHFTADCRTKTSQLQRAAEFDKEANLLWESKTVGKKFVEQPGTVGEAVIKFVCSQNSS